MSDKTITVMAIFGVRPEAIKMAPVIKELEKSPAFRVIVVVTAQHREMLDQVLEHFRIRPAYDLNIMRPQQSLTDITVRALRGLEPIIREEKPDVILVHGDTSTTFAASLAAFYQKIPVGHVEAGLRTHDKYSPYPEEMNRKLTAAIADYNFAPTKRARLNLIREGVDEKTIYVTGNTAIDALLLTIRDDYEFKDRKLRKILSDACSGRPIIIIDVHRRENFGERMESICEGIYLVARARPDLAILFSVHRNPEVEKVVHGRLSGTNVVLCDPVAYPDWAHLMKAAYLILTDSGGLQEEAPSLGTPVLLLRDVTERPEAIEAGTVKLIGVSPEAIVDNTLELLENDLEYKRMSKSINPYGDGRAAERIVEALKYEFGLSDVRPVDFPVSLKA